MSNSYHLARQYVLRLPLAALLTEIEKQVTSRPQDEVKQGVEVVDSVGVPR